jgi:hypothetical protein
MWKSLAVRFRSLLLRRKLCMSKQRYTRPVRTLTQQEDLKLTRRRMCSRDQKKIAPGCPQRAPRWTHWKTHLCVRSWRAWLRAANRSLAFFTSQQPRDDRPKTRQHHIRHRPQTSQYHRYWWHHHPQKLKRSTSPWSQYLYVQITKGFASHEWPRNSLQHEKAISHSFGDETETICAGSVIALPWRLHTLTP